MEINSGPEKEKEDKIQKSFEVKVDVNPDYHPKIIGHKGSVISKIRDDFDVNIQLPRKGAEDANIITKKHWFTAYKV